MSTFHLIDKVEEALKAVVGGTVTDTQIDTGKSAEDKALPIIVCMGNGEVEEDPPGSGNFWITWSIETRQKAIVNRGDTPAAIREAGKSLSDKVSDAIQRTDIADLLTAAVDDFTVFPGAVIFNSPKSGHGENGAWVDELSGRMYCCGSDLT